jgi:hypothetical protein
LATIPDSEIHQFIQETDKNALHDLDDEGDHAPLLLVTLDLSYWTSIMIVATTDKEKGLGRLREDQQVLGQLLEKDEMELEEAMRNTHTVENAL